MRWRTVFFYLVVQWFCLEGAALAQDDAASAASARALFQEGVSLADSAQWEEAADRFQRALSLRDSTVIRFNLASALFELNRLVEASELLHQVVRDPSAEAPLRSDASSRLTVVNSRIAKLTIDVEGDLSGVSVRLDDREVASAMFGMAMPVDPGVHQLRALRATEEIDAKTVELGHGDTQSVVLSAVRVVTPNEAAATVNLGTQPAFAASRNDQDEKVSRRSSALWWAIGGGALAVAVGAIVTVLATRDSGDSAPKPYQGDFEQSSVRVQVSQ